MQGKKLDILVALQLTLGVLTVLLGTYSLVTDRFHLQPLMFIFMSAMFGVIGYREYKRTQNKHEGLFYWIVSGFILGVALVALFVN